MSIHGVDISRYQGAEAMDGFSFVIVNAEDPTFDAKIHRARTQGIPWAPYTWIYPGNGRRDMQRAVDRAAPHGDPPLGYWLDYEQAGVSQADIDAALDRARELGVLDRTGIYTYLYMVDGVDLRGRPLWLAYYPGFNDGSYPAAQDYDARRHGAVLWQYTSGANAPVGLDRNVVIDEAWWSSWIGAPLPTTPTPHLVPQEDAMIYVAISDGPTKPGELFPRVGAGHSYVKDGEQVVWLENIPKFSPGFSDVPGELKHCAWVPASGATIDALWKDADVQRGYDTYTPAVTA